MQSGFKKIIFVLLGLAVIVSAFLLFQSNYVHASKSKKSGTKFDDWVVSCTNQDEKQGEKQEKEKKEDADFSPMCLISQQVSVSQDKSQQILALYQMGHFGPKKELKLIITLPLGIKLDPGTSIISSKKLIAPGKFTICTEAGCQAISNISESDLKTILNADENTLAFMNAEGNQIGLPFSTKGLSKAINYIK